APPLEPSCSSRERPPVTLDRELTRLAGELSTFVRPQTRRPRPTPGYDHAQLYASLRPLVDEGHDLLNQVQIRGAQPIPLT
ncbi:type VI secretion system baseplate subunit TssK, partial [Burkholderia pseudomallei]